MKRTFITTLIFLTFILAACGASNTQTTNPTGNNNSFGNAPLPLATELMIGTFKLEGTDQAVTADQAAQLIPLWQVYKDLSTNGSAAQQEIDALAEQIQGTMTPEQVQAITDMKLTQGDIFQTMQDMGIASANRLNASGTPRPGGGQGGNFSGGGNGVPGGGNFQGGGNGAPDGGQGFNNGQNISPEQIATFQARSAQNGGTESIPSALYDVLIKLLQSKK